jgi:hypothetical protein
VIHRAKKSLLQIPTVSSMEPPIVLSLELSSSPDFTHLLKSNDIPLNSDIPFIRNIISNGQTRLDELNDQIENLQVRCIGVVRSIAYLLVFRLNLRNSLGRAAR